MVTRESPAITVAMLWDSVEALVSAISARNNTSDHSVRVADYAIRVARAAGLSEQTLEQIRLGALLHDIGQICWSDALIAKQGSPLTEEERKIIESHTYRGADLIKNWPSLEFARPYILYHQEWIDGSGYPYGIGGDALPIEVQIVSLADVYEALRSPREYRKRPAFSPRQAVEVMSSMRGKRWQEELFDMFARTVEEWQS